ncbi:uncharacterized protein LOC123701480 [Colias croceus]|uniref:uncharacterized protein LOC123701480 n=1 Tax=Colias crocea TaxID=72248 RepID=UPI001E27A432|nr:uncharacterized protein LOC123701480 [Colias croceus]
MFHKLYMLILCIFNIQNTQRCILNTRVNFGQPLPVILRNGKLLEPDDNNGNVILNYGDTLTLSCGESMSIRHPNAKQEVPTAIISCENGDTFKNEELLNFPGSFSSFRCNDAPDYHSRRTNQRATFHYVNCAPQWGGFNGGNWNTLEVDLRNHVHQVGYNTVIYTGTYGITQLTNQYGQRVDLYLHGTVIPIPQYFYKVVYEPSSKKGIAYVGINNPYYSLREAKEMFFCEDMCRSNNNFSWLTWHPDNPSEGYTFCCTIPDFRATINHLPYFDVSGVLI